MCKPTASYPVPATLSVQITLPVNSYNGYASAREEGPDEAQRWCSMRPRGGLSKLDNQQLWDFVKAVSVRSA